MIAGGVVNRDHAMLEFLLKVDCPFSLPVLIKASTYVAVDAQPFVTSRTPIGAHMK